MQQTFSFAHLKADSHYAAAFDAVQADRYTHCGLLQINKKLTLPKDRILVALIQVTEFCAANIL